MHLAARLLRRLTLALGTLLAGPAPRPMAAWRRQTPSTAPNGRRGSCSNRRPRHQQPERCRSGEGDADYGAGAAEGRRSAGPSPRCHGAPPHRTDPHGARSTADVRRTDRHAQRRHGRRL